MVGNAVTETAIQEVTVPGLGKFDKSSSASKDEKIGGQSTKIAFRVPLMIGFANDGADGAATHMKKVSDEGFCFGNDASSAGSVNFWKEASSSRGTHFLPLEALTSHNVMANLRGRAGPLCPMATIQSPRRGYSSSSSELENQICKYDEKTIQTKLDAIDETFKKELAVIALDIKEVNDKLSKQVPGEWMSISIKGRALNIAGVVSLGWCVYEAISKFTG